MRTLKLTVAYDGTPFVGWQRQAEGVSIQGLLEDGLARLEGAPVTAHGAGRTDAGVHALGQVATAEVTFAHDPATVVRALNARLPPEVRVVDAAEMPPGFHARFSSTSKAYRYLIAIAPVMSPVAAPFAWHVTERLDVAAMEGAADEMVGTHDFTSFQSAGTLVSTPVRTLTRSTLTRVDDLFPGSGPMLAYDVEGDGFLRHMVRAIVGTLVTVGRGWKPVEWVPQVLAARDRHAAGATAPPHGLWLMAVRYDGADRAKSALEAGAEPPTEPQ